jgi:parallel beta-helix repeat protein
MFHIPGIRSIVLFATLIFFSLNSYSYECVNFFVKNSTKDGHLSEIEVALKELATLRASGSVGDACIVIPAGYYIFEKPIDLHSTSFTTGGFKTIFRSASNREVVFSGGVRVLPSVFKGSNIWHFEKPNSCGKSVGHAIFTNGNRRYRARLPKSGYFTIDENKARDLVDGRYRDAFYYGKDLVSYLPGVDENSEVVAFHYWSMSRLGVYAVNHEQHSLTLNGLTSHTDVWARFGKGGKYYIENVNPSYMVPGEWVVRDNDIQYSPTEDDLKKYKDGSLEVVLPCIPTLMRIDGVDNVFFEGIKFIYTADSSGVYSQTPAQAGIGPDVSAAVELSNSKNINFTHVGFEHLAGFGLMIARDVKSTIVEKSIFSDMGGGAIIIGDARNAYKKTDAVMPVIYTGNLVNNSIIRGGGKIREDSVAIWIGDVGGNIITNNEISDFGYTAISIGWNWGGSHISRRNKVEGNHISLVGRGGLSDLSGIYTLADSTETTIKSNYISNVTGATYGGFGIYLDRESNGLIVDGNAVSKVSQAGIALHFAGSNTVTNNNVCSAPKPSVVVIQPGAHENTIFNNVCMDSAGVRNED